MDLALLREMYSRFPFGRRNILLFLNCMLQSKFIYNFRIHQDQWDEFICYHLYHNNQQHENDSLIQNLE
jgi:hypothetical protein